VSSDDGFHGILNGNDQRQFTCPWDSRVSSRPCCAPAGAEGQRLGAASPNPSSSPEFRGEAGGLG